MKKWIKEAEELLNRLEKAQQISEWNDLDLTGKKAQIEVLPFEIKTLWLEVKKGLKPARS